MSRHDSLQDTLASVEKKNRAALRNHTDQPDPERGMGATLVTAWTRRPATIIRVEERRMFVQEDLVCLEFGMDPSVSRNEKGVLHGFRRVKGSKKWNYASDWRIRGQRTLGIIIGERQVEEPYIGEYDDQQIAESLKRNMDDVEVP